MADQPQLVGRDAEQLRLNAAVLAAVEESDFGERVARAAVLIGATGVGKTALARNTAQLASAQGRRVTWIQASSAASGVPLGAFVPALGPIDDDIAPASLLARAHRILGRSASEVEPLLIVDDAHLLDALSVALVEQLVAGSQSAVLLTARNDGPVPVASRLWRDEHVERIDVAALPPDAVDLLLTAMLDGAVDGALTRAVTRLSAGNLVILRELVGSAVDRGAIAFEGSWRLVGELVASSRLAELVEARLATLPKAHRRALDLLALAELLPLELATNLVGSDVLADLEDARLVELMEVHAARQVTVSHGTYATVLRSSIGPIRARTLYEALADAAAGHSSTSGAGGDPHEVLRRTRWRLAAGQDPPPDELLHAGKLARQAYDVDLAEKCGRALLATGLSVDGGLLLADVLMTSGRAADAEATLLAIVPDATTDEDIVAVTEARGRNLLHGLRDREGALAVTEEGLTRVTSDRQGNRLRAHLAVFDFFAGDLRSALERGEPLLAGDAPAEATFAVAAAYAMMGQTTRAFALTTNAPAVDEERVTIVPGAIVEIGRSILLVHHGLPREALQMALDAHSRAVDVGFEYARSWLAYSVGIAYSNLGRVATARRWFQEAAVALAADRSDPRSRPAVAGDLWCAASLGLRDEAAALRVRLDRLVMPTWGWFEGAAVRALAWEALLGQDRSTAVKRLRSSADDLRANHSFLLEAEALHDVVRLDAADADVVARLGELEGIAEGPLIACRATHARAALASDAAGLTEVAAAYEEMGFALYAAEAASQAARLLRRAGSNREATAAERRAHDLASLCEGAATPALARAGAAAELTNREIEIARLAIEGLRSREIADQLFLSRRTVDNYLQRVFVKLGISDRSDLAEALEGVRP